MGRYFHNEIQTIQYCWQKDLTPSLIMSSVIKYEIHVHLPQCLLYPAYTLYHESKKKKVNKDVI